MGAAGEAADALADGEFLGVHENDAPVRLALLRAKMGYPQEMVIAGK